MKMLKGIWQIFLFLVIVLYFIECQTHSKSLRSSRAAENPKFQTSGEASINAGSQNSANTSGQINSSTSGQASPNICSQNSGQASGNIGSQTSGHGSINPGSPNSAQPSKSIDSQTSTNGSIKAGSPNTAQPSKSIDSKTSGSGSINTGSPNSAQPSKSIGSQTSTNESIKAGSQNSAQPSKSIDFKTSGSGSINVGSQNSAQASKNIGSQTSGNASTGVDLQTSAQVSTSLDIKLNYCGFDCGVGKKEKVETIINGYYWRDYLGIIPPDAFPIGNANQSPQTYIGSGFDASKNGTFPVTIVKGLPYVHTVVREKVKKITKTIQILCTMQPEKMIWMALDSKNAKEAQTGRSVVRASFHVDQIQKQYKTHFVVSTSNDGTTYAGYSSSLSDTMEYVLINGTAQSTTNYQFLLFSMRENENNQKNEKNGFSFEYDINVQAGSQLPQFHGKISLGACSITCTNQKKLDTEDKMKVQMSKNALKYYWKPRKIFDNKEGLEAGIYKNKTCYVGQAYTSINLFDVGRLNNYGVVLSTEGYSVDESTDVRVLSTCHPEFFEWRNSTKDTFASLEKSKMVPGGQLADGSQTFIGRVFFFGVIDPGSVHVTARGAIVNDIFGAHEEFQVLMIKD